MKNFLINIYFLLGFVVWCATVTSCVQEKLSCKQENIIECKDDLREKSKDEKYTILILSYDSKFDLDELRFYKDSSLITKKLIEGDYDNPQNDPKRLTIELNKAKVQTITVVFRGVCYKLILKKMFDNYVVDYDLRKMSFSAIANNQEFLTFE